MEVSSNRTFPNPYLENTQADSSTSAKENKGENLLETMEKAAVEVALSMNAQIVLFSMDSSQLNKGNITAQKEIFEFLSGKVLEDGSSLENIGYEGKPITELSVDEANDLLSEDGFFGVTQTSDRVAEFALSFSDDPEIIKQVLDGIKQGFSEAEKLWGGELPEISYETQNRTIELIEKRLEELENSGEEPGESVSDKEVE